MLVWEEYLKKKTLYFNLTDLENTAVEFTNANFEKLFDCDYIRFLNFSEVDQSILKPIEIIKQEFK